MNKWNSRYKRQKQGNNSQDLIVFTFSAHYYGLVVSLSRISLFRDVSETDKVVFTVK